MTLLVSDWTILFPSEVSSRLQLDPCNHPNANIIHDHHEYVKVELIWRSKWSLTKVLYLLSRYSPFIDTPLNIAYYLTPDIRPDTCDAVYSIGVWITGYGIGLAELVLLVRTYAIYARSRRVLVFLVILWLLWIGGNSAVFYFFTTSVQYVESTKLGLGRDLPGCYTESESPIIFASFASLALFEFVIVSMTIKKGFEHFRDATYLHGRSLAFVLYRDGVLFFIALLVFSTANVVLDVAAPREYLDLLNTLTRVIHSIVCCRVLLNLRNAGRSDLDVSHRLRSSESEEYSSCNTIVFRRLDRDRELRAEGWYSMSRGSGMPVSVAGSSMSRQAWSEDRYERAYGGETVMEMERIERIELEPEPSLSVRAPV
ncbi:hypothetical protein K474DRAFT_1382460 [Panus rudis PR-1116 ss-1]|nr:hypothetical protein K474DRAFT_1382460 [Panus rudis PR-1116 ss-1]